MLTSSLYLIFVSIGAILAALGKLRREDGKITRIGWLTVLSLVLALVLGVAKEIRSHGNNLLAEEVTKGLREELAAAMVSNEELRTSFGAASSKLNEAVAALSVIANSSQIEPASGNLAAGTLDRIFNLKKLAVVKVKAVVGGKLREKSGFFVNGSGAVITADFAVTDLPAIGESFNVHIEIGDGTTHPANVVYVNSELSVALLATQVRSDSFLTLAGRSPKLDEEVLIIGFTPDEFLTRASGHVAKVGPVEGLYLRDRDSLPGFGGGPILSEDGFVIGLNWGALEPPIKGSAKFIRADRVAASLQNAEIDVF